MYAMISRTRLLLSAAAAATAVFAPTASAMHAPCDGGCVTSADSKPANVAIQYNQLGPKYVSLPHVSSGARYLTRESR